MADVPDDLFRLLYSRAATDDDRQRLVAVKSALGLSARDELWPIILTLDHYAEANRAARVATVKELHLVLDALKSVPERAGPIAAAKAREAVAAAVAGAADTIAKAAIDKARTRADRLSKRQFLVAGIIGALVACALAAAGAAAMYVLLEGRGICAMRPGFAQDGSLVCYVGSPLG